MADTEILQGSADKEKNIFCRGSANELGCQEWGSLLQTINHQNEEEYSDPCIKVTSKCYFTYWGGGDSFLASVDDSKKEKEKLIIKKRKTDKMHFKEAGSAEGEMV